MRFEVAIKATKKEIERLQKRHQVIQENIDEYCNIRSLEEKLTNKSIRQGELESSIKWHEAKISKLSPKLLREYKAELTEVTKELASVRKIWRLDLSKEMDKQFKIKDQIEELQQELLYLKRVAER